MRKLTLLFPCLLVVMIACHITKAQSAEWTRIETEDKDLSVSFPPGFITDAVKRKSSGQKYSIIGFQNGVMMKLRVLDEDDPKVRLRNIAFFSTDTASSFKKDTFEGKRNVSKDSEKSYLDTIYLASKKHFYSLEVKATDKNKPEISQFLRSIKINGSPLFVSTTTTPVSEKLISLTELQTSPEVTVALAREPAKDKIPSTIKRFSEAPKESLDHTAFSRPPIIVEKTYPSFRPPTPDITNLSLSKGQKYYASLKVTFLADGTIGEVTVYSDADSIFTKACINAAKKIKFIPAQINGVNVDSTDMIDYRFESRIFATSTTIIGPMPRPN